MQTRATILYGPKNEEHAFEDLGSNWMLFVRS